MSQAAIPFFAAAREYGAHRQEFLDAIDRALSTGQFLQGKEVADVETRVAALARRRHGVAVNSCTDALFFSLLAAGIKTGDEVLVTDFSFVASASCITRAGATPVFVDVDATYNIDLSKADKLVTARTKALILVHLYGQMADPMAAEAFCHRHHIVLIEDAAQAIGAHRAGRRAGSLGLVSCISFDPTKPISAPGSGGIALTDDDHVAERLRQLRYHGRPDGKSLFMSLGYNSQMPSATAAVLNVKLDYHEEWLAKRRAMASRFIDGLEDLPNLTLPTEVESETHIYHKFVVRHPNRDALQKFLGERGIQSTVHYGLPLHKQPCFSAVPHDDERFLVADRFSREVLSLPIHPFISTVDETDIVNAVRDFCRSPQP